jgi:hypothetical protein
MSLFSLLTRRNGLRRKTAHKGRPGFRPTLEELEGRWVPSDFSISVNPSNVRILQAGSSGTASVATATTAGTAEIVALSASGLPSGATASFSPASVTSGASSNLTLTTSASTPTGTFTVTITGTASSGSHTTTLSLTIGPITLVVTNTNDTGVSGDGSLRGEIAAAAGGDMIEFARPVYGKKITLDPTKGPLTINKNLDIEGPVSNLVSISGNNATEVFEIDSGTVTLSGLMIKQGGPAFASGTFGGGIDNFGVLTVSQCTVSDNSAGNGGGIFNEPGATLTVSSCRLSANSAINGGGINNDGGTVTISNSTLSGNSAGQGGGIFNGGTLTISDSTLSGNAANQGGGIYNDGGATLFVLDNSTIRHNTPDDVKNLGVLHQDNTSTIGIID